MWAVVTLTKLSGADLCQTVAGGGTLPLDAVPALTQPINVAAVASDNRGGVFIATGLWSTIHWVSSDGLIFRLAGTGNYMQIQQGEVPYSPLGFPFQLALDQTGNLYFADGTPRIGKINRDGVVSRAVGDGSWGAPIDGALASQTPVRSVSALAVGPQGEIAFVDDYGASDFQHRTLFRES